MRIKQLRHPKASTAAACDPRAPLMTIARNSTSRQGDIGVGPVSQRVAQRHLPPQFIALDPQHTRTKGATIVNGDPAKHL
jgi:hypothetical protein